MRILYMNQGGGEWGGIDYSDYDVLLLAEWSEPKSKFEVTWLSSDKPQMSIQHKAKDKNGYDLREMIGIEDLDRALHKAVRPIMTFTTRDGIRVVFVHLKSGNENLATEELRIAIETLKNEIKSKRPILWIGDFNRADAKYLKDKLGGMLFFEDGGQSEWNLDRAYTTGDWKQFTFGSDRNPIAKSTDHGHAAIEFNYRRH